VGEQLETVVLLTEHDVAEAVVEVLVGVDYRHDIACAQPSHLLDHLAGLDLGGMGVDHQETPVTGDHTDVQVEELVAGHPAPLGDLDEPLSLSISAGGEAAVMTQRLRRWVPRPLTMT